MAELNRQLTPPNQQDRLLNLRLPDEVNERTFGTENIELRDRIAELSLQVQAGDRERQEQAATAEKMFELSQTLASDGLTRIAGRNASCSIFSV